MPISVLFFGTPDFSAVSLRALLQNPDFRVKLIVTQPDRPAGRGQKVSMSPVKETAIQHSIPVLQPASIKKEGAAFLELVRSHGHFDIGVVVAFGQILPVSVLQVPAAGCVNVHASLLPRWRGAAPIQRAILSGDDRTGVCLMQMEAGLDSGPVYLRRETPITDQDNFETLHDRLAALGAALLSESLNALVNGKIQPEAQAAQGMTYAPRIEAAEGHINWHKTAHEINCQVRGLSPCPGAFTTLENRRLKIFKAKVSPAGEGGSAALTAGTVVSVKEDRIAVQCGHDALELLEVQLENRKRLSVVDFLRGFPLKPGVQLGQ